MIIRNSLLLSLATVSSLSAMFSGDSQNSRSTSAASSVEHTRATTPPSYRDFIANSGTSLTPGTPPSYGDFIASGGNSPIQGTPPSYMQTMASGSSNPDSMVSGIEVLSMENLYFDEATNTTIRQNNPYKAANHYAD